MLCCHDTWFHLKLTILKPWVNQYIFLMEMFVLSSVNVPQTLSSSWFHQMAQPTWQTGMLYSDAVPLIYVNETICLVICPSTRFQSIVLWLGMNYLVPFWVLRHSFLPLADCLWLYNIQLKTSRRVLFLLPSDACVRSFLYFLYTLIKVHYTKALSDPASSLALDWIRLLRRPSIPASYRSPTTFHRETLWQPSKTPTQAYINAFSIKAYNHRNSLQI